MRWASYKAQFPINVPRLEKTSLVRQWNADLST